MPITGDIKMVSKYVQLGNRHDYCFLCAMEVTGKNDVEYNQKFQALKGKLDGRPVVKIRRSGTDTCICMEHIHQLAKDHPLPKEDK